MADASWKDKTDNTDDETDDKNNDPSSSFAFDFDRISGS